MHADNPISEGMKCLKCQGGRYCKLDFAGLLHSLQGHGVVTS